VTIPNKRVAVLSPVAWRTPPRQYGAWETVAGNIAEGLVARGWDVTLFATRDSVTRAHLHAVVDKGYEEHSGVDPKVAEYLHISEVFEHAAEFDLIHSHYWMSGMAAGKLSDAWGGTPIIQMFHTLGEMKNRVAQSDDERESSERILGEKRVLARADRIIVATLAELTQLRLLFVFAVHLR